MHVRVWTRIFTGYRFEGSQQCDMMSCMHNKHARSGDRSKMVAIPAVSAYSSRKEWETACWQRLLGSRGWLNLITPYERHNIIMRAAVAHRLSEQTSYKDIGRELWLSSQTISAIKKGIGEKRYRSYADRGTTERKKKVYSMSRSVRPHRKIRTPRRTKYGTVYL